MKGILMVSALMTVGMLFPAAAGVRSQTQGLRIPPQGPRSVKMRTLRPGDILYVLLGGGGNTLALMREDGVVVIDTKLPGWGRPILHAIQAATDRPVRCDLRQGAYLQAASTALVSISSRCACITMSDRAESSPRP